MAKSERLAEAKRETEARDKIFLALKEWRDEQGHRIVNGMHEGEDLADKLFEYLREKGLLKLQDDEG
jgi:hypothetical protein